MSITFPVTLFIHQANPMRCIMLPSVASLDLQYFTTLFHKPLRFLGEKIFNTNCVLVCFGHTTYVRNISHSKNNVVR